MISLKSYEMLEHSDDAAVEESSDGVALPFPPLPRELRLYVSNSLDQCWVEADADNPSHHEENGNTFYPLTPVHFAWLHYRMGKAQAAFKAKKLCQLEWDAARERFNSIKTEAVHLFGEESLLAEVKTFNPKAYVLPVAQWDGKQRSFRHGDTLPKSCPYEMEYLIKCAREYPHLVPCAASIPPWWWVERHYCETKCRGHSECIRPMLWVEKTKQHACRTEGA